MKNIGVAALLFVVIIVFFLSACGKKNQKVSDTTADAKTNMKSTQHVVEDGMQKALGEAAKKSVMKEYDLGEETGDEDNQIINLREIGYSQNLPEGFPEEEIPLSDDAQIMLAEDTPDEGLTKLAYLTTESVQDVKDFYSDVFSDAEEVTPSRDKPGGIEVYTEAYAITVFPMAYGDEMTYVLIETFRFDHVMSGESKQLIKDFPEKELLIPDDAFIIESYKEGDDTWTTLYFTKMSWNDTVSFYKSILNSYSDYCVYEYDSSTTMTARTPDHFIEVSVSVQNRGITKVEIFVHPKDYYGIG